MVYGPIFLSSRVSKYQSGDLGRCSWPLDYNDELVRDWCSFLPQRVFLPLNA